MVRGRSRRPGFRITAVQALFFLGVCLLVGAHASLHDLDLSSTAHGSHDPATSFHEHPMLLVVSSILIALSALLGLRCRGAAARAVRSGLRASPVTRCDNDVGLYLLLSTFRI